MKETGGQEREEGRKGRLLGEICRNIHPCRKMSECSTLQQNNKIKFEKACLEIKKKRSKKGKTAKPNPRDWI